MLEIAMTMTLCYLSLGAITESKTMAEKIIKTIKQHPRGKWLTILTGVRIFSQSHRLFSEAGIHHRTPEGPITAYMHGGISP